MQYWRNIYPEFLEAVFTQNVPPLAFGVPVHYEDKSDHLEEYLEDLDIDLLAEAFYISKFHMMRLFRRETGSTVHTYLLQRRLLHARELIRGGMRATEACYRSGFRSYSSFTRAYNKHFGTTPTGRMDRLRDTPGEDE